MFDTKLKNVESEEEAAAEGKEEFLQLSCFIQQEVKYMHTGLRSKVRAIEIIQFDDWDSYDSSPIHHQFLTFILINFVVFQLEENITKFSSTLGRDAEYLKTSRISRLPSYLAIQVMIVLGG